MLSQYSGENIGHVKSLYNVVQEARDKITQEKFLLNVGLISLGQHGTGKILMENYPRDSIQRCGGKNIVQSCLNTLEATFHK